MAFKTSTRLMWAECNNLTTSLQSCFSLSHTYIVETTPKTEALRPQAGPTGARRKRTHRSQARWWTLGDEGWQCWAPQKTNPKVLMTLGIITIQYTYMIITMISYMILILFKSKQSLGEYRNPGRIPFSFAKKPGAWEVLRSRRAL
jgi:hypothetical protein